MGLEIFTQMVVTVQLVALIAVGVWSFVKKDESDDAYRDCLKRLNLLEVKVAVYETTGSLEKPTGAYRFDNIVNLWTVMNDLLSDEDVEFIMFALRISDGNIAGDTKSARIRNLIVHAEQHGIADELAAMLTELRPRANWPRME